MNYDWLKRDDYSPSIRNLLKKHSDEIITSITIVRTPLKQFLNLLLNVVSMGEFNNIKNRNKYDDYFHLHLNITTNKTLFVLEKNHVLNLKTGNMLNENSESLKVENIPQNLTLSTLMENTKLKQGKKFFNYKASNNNCQIFVRDVLQSNNMNNETYNSFIMQNTQSIFEKKSTLRKAVNTVTDIASIADHLVYGAGVYDFDTTLTNFDLKDLAIKMNIILTNVIPKDMLKGKLENGRYILNLENSDQGGSHWVAFLKEGSNIYYFDSFAGYPLQPLIDLCKKNKYHIEYNITQVQDMSSILCGWYCLAFLKYLEVNKKNNTVLKNCFKFTDMFKHDTKKNDKILIKYITKLL